MRISNASINIVLGAFTVLYFISCGVEEPICKHPKPIPVPGDPMPKEPEPIPEPIPEPKPEPKPIPEPSENLCIAKGKTYAVKRGSYGRGGFVYYPDVKDGCKMVVTSGQNGTGAPSIFYVNQARSLASKGYLVVWPNNPQTGSGRTCMESIAWAFTQPGVSKKYATVTGHSQGGSATVVCMGLLKEKYPELKTAGLPSQAACGMSRPDWSRLARKIDGKMLFYAGSRDTIVPMRWVRQCYDQVRTNKYLIVGEGSTHMNTSRYVPSLLPVWFDYALFPSKETERRLFLATGSAKYRWIYKPRSL